MNKAKKFKPMPRKAAASSDVVTDLDQQREPEGENSGQSSSHRLCKVCSSPIKSLVEMYDGQPCSKKIGFLGLGILGKGIVKNLLNSGHFVSVWDPMLNERFASLKCDTKRLCKKKTPAAVVATSDITFCCIDDSNDVKALIFENSGVLKGFKKNSKGKGYVQMTSIDPETCLDIAKAIELKQGRYLEAFVSQSKKKSEEGSLFIVAAGNHSLFYDCATCFNGISKQMLYTNCAPGTAAKHNLVINMLHGTVYSALAETLSFVSRINLPQKDFVKFLQLSRFSSPALVDQANAIIEKDSSAMDMPLKPVINDLKLALKMGEKCNQPTPIAESASKIILVDQANAMIEKDSSSMDMLLKPEEDDVNCFVM